MVELISAPYLPTFSSAFSSACGLHGNEVGFIDGCSVEPHAGLGDDPAVNGYGDVVCFAARQRVGELGVEVVHVCADCLPESGGVAEVVAHFAVGRGLGSNGDGLSAKPPGSLWRWGAVRYLPC